MDESGLVGGLDPARHIRHQHGGPSSVELRLDLRQGQPSDELHGDIRPIAIQA